MPLIPRIPTVDSTDTSSTSLDSDAGLRSDDFYLEIIHATHIDPRTMINDDPYTAQHILIDAVFTLTDQDYAEMVSILRRLHSEGRLPEEWLAEVENLTAVYSNFSSPIEVAYFATVRDFSVTAIYNFYTPTETDRTIENRAVDYIGQQVPRCMLLTWEPISPQEDILEDPLVPIDEIAVDSDLLSSVANNISGNTMEISVESTDPAIIEGIRRI